MGFSSINVASPHICLLTGPPRLNLRGNGFDKSFKVRVWLWMVTAVASERCQACSVSLGGCQRGIQLTTQTHAHRNVQTARYPPASVTMETDRPPIEKKSSDAGVCVQPCACALVNTFVGAWRCGFAFQRLPFCGDEQGHLQIHAKIHILKVSCTLFKFTAGFQKTKQTKKIDTYSEESIKYIPRAPMLSAKTNTTCREENTNKSNYSHAQGIPKNPRPPAGHRTPCLHMTTLSVCPTDLKLSYMQSSTRCTADACTGWDTGSDSYRMPTCTQVKLCIVRDCDPVNLFKSPQAPCGSRRSSL